MNPFHARHVRENGHLELLVEIVEIQKDVQVSVVIVDAVDPRVGAVGRLGVRRC